MKKSQAKSKLSINTPNPNKSHHIEPSPVLGYVKLQKQSTRYKPSVPNTVSRQDTFSPPTTFTQKPIASQTTGSGASRLLFFKSKTGTSANELLFKENNNPNIPTESSEKGIIPIEYRTLDYRTEKHDSSMSSNNLHERRLTTPNKDLLMRIQSENLKKTSPGHIKSASIAPPFLAESRYHKGPGKGTPSHNAKTLSVSSGENLLKNNFLNSNSSLYGSKNFQGISKDLTESDDKNLKSMLIPQGERCNNHPHKKGKYYVVSDTDEPETNQKYCSKCAMKLVKNGVNVQEILSSEEAMRKSQIEEFLIKLSNTKREVEGFTHSMSRKKEDLTTFFSKQTEKINLICSTLAELIEEERKKCLETLDANHMKCLEEFKKYEGLATHNACELVLIQDDIEKNINEIVKNVELNWFKLVITDHEGRVKAVEENIKNFKAIQLQIHKLPSFNPKCADKLRPFFSNFFNLLKLTTGIVKKSENADEIARKNAELKGINLNKSSLYISFENKEMFENAMNSSTSEYPLRRQSDLYSYANLSGSRSEFPVSKLNSTMPLFSNAKSGHDPRVKRTELDLEDLACKDANKTPRERRLSNFFCMTSYSKQGNSIMSNAIQEENNENNSEKDNLMVSTFTEKDYSIDSMMDDGKIANGLKSTKKYMNILDKINANQSKKNIYYSNLMKANPMISPRCTNQTEESSKEKGSNGKPRENNTLHGYGLFDSEHKSHHFPIHPFGSDTKGDNQVKNYENLVGFIEDKLNNEKSPSHHPNYQKTLFCSPTFKENISPRLSEQSSSQFQFYVQISISYKFTQRTLFLNFFY